MRRVWDVMGMPITVDVRDKGAEEPVFDEVFADLVLVDETFSPFIPDSAVSRIDRGELALEDASGLVSQVLQLCRQYEFATNGYFAAWTAGHLDPSGLVKGWAIDRAARILDRCGYRHYFVDAAGDVRTRCPEEAGAPWRIGIRHPVERDKVARVILANDLAVATSGTYEKGAHIRDPHTGSQAQEWLSFTVIGPDIVEADVYATAALAMGKRGLAFIEEIPRLQGYAIDRQLRATWTSGFAEVCGAGESGGG